MAREAMFNGFRLARGSIREDGCADQTLRFWRIPQNKPRIQIDQGTGASHHAECDRGGCRLERCGTTEANWSFDKAVRQCRQSERNANQSQLDERARLLEVEDSREGKQRPMPQIQRIANETDVDEHMVTENIAPHR